MPHDRSAVVDPQAAKKKKQLAIIVLLLAGLLIAVATQPQGKTRDAKTLIAEPVSLKVIDSTSVADDGFPRDEITSTRELSRLEIDRIVQTRLFDLPEPEPLSEPETAVEESPSEVTVQAIYGDGKLTENSQSSGHRVLIGRAIIRPGDVLPDGRQVLSVTPDGVELTP